MQLILTQVNQEDVGTQAPLVLLVLLVPQELMGLRGHRVTWALWGMLVRKEFLEFPVPREILESQDPWGHPAHQELR